MLPLIPRYCRWRTILIASLGRACASVVPELVAHVPESQHIVFDRIISGEALAVNHDRHPIGIGFPCTAAHSTRNSQLGLSIFFEIDKGRRARVVGESPDTADRRRAARCADSFHDDIVPEQVV